MDRTQKQKGSTSQKDLRAVLVDDEENARVSLRIMLDDFCKGVKIVGQAEDVASAVQVINEKKPDLVFLDVEMPDGNGFNVLDQVKYKDFQVVFVTAFDNYAVRAFKYAALDYLLKPVEIESLKKALDRARESGLPKPESEDTKLANVYNNLESNDQILIPNQGGYRSLQTKDIMYCKAEGNYTYFFSASGDKLISSYRLGYYDDLLKNKGFIRTHKSYLINKHHILEIPPRSKNVVILKDGTQIALSFRRRKGVLQALQMG